MTEFAIFCHLTYCNDMPSQTSMNISLPKALRQWVEQRVGREGYGTASEYLRELIRQDQRRKARLAIDRKLIEAMESGEAAEMTDQDWKHIRATVRQRLARKPKARQ